MQAIQTLLKLELENDASVLFLAPTGWGKTTLLLELAKKSNKSIVYLSPLRALANEFHMRCLQTGLVSAAPKGLRELNKLIGSGIKIELFILTAELLSERFIETCLEDKIVVFDEFHLFYYWGRSFRPKLLEAYEIASLAGLPSLLLTATASEEVQSFWEQTSAPRQNRYLINLGNQKIKKEPKRFYWIPRKKLALKALELALPGTVLVFCKYRSEAKGLAELWRSKGHSTLSCVSGEVEKFQRNLAAKEAKREKVDFIFSTSTLSHGVNLPEIGCLCILYEVGNLDLWLQMAGRAGRRGEEFILVSADRGNRSLKALLISLFRFLCDYVLEKVGSVYHAFRRDYRS